MRSNPDAIRVAIIGVNHAATYCGYEGDRTFVADRPPGPEAAEVIQRINARIPPFYNEVLIAKYNATNMAPFPFTWSNEPELKRNYASILLRVSQLYSARFP